MSDIEISEVSSRRERDAFIKFPWKIYADDPAWVPPLIIERKEFLNRNRHPFYRHGDAALFLARKNGQIVGRIMASDDIVVGNHVARLRRAEPRRGRVERRPELQCAASIECRMLWFI